MSAEKLDFQRDGGNFKALGFGKDGICRSTGRVGQNADVTTFCYDSQKEELEVTALRSDRKYGSDLRAKQTIKGLSADEAKAFSTVMNAAIIGIVEGRYGNPKNSKAQIKSYNDIITEEGELINSNALSSILSVAREQTQSAMAPASKALDDIAEFFKDHVVSSDIQYGSVKNTKDEHLQDTKRLVSKKDPSTVIFFKVDDRRIDIWDTNIDGNNMAGWVPAFTDDPQGRNSSIAYMTNALGLADPLGSNGALRSKLYARCAATEAASGCGVKLSGSKQEARAPKSQFDGRPQPGNCGRPIAMRM
ncbi:MAG: hypothetical protein PHD48_06995 [Alphaproteobacteria bacterium]|nr:hypothetical protein [Alphaproteobacteria bacterium]